MAALLPSCALCGGRDARTETDYEGRIVPACYTCLAEVAEPEEHIVRDMLTRRLLRAARHFDRFTTQDIAVALDVGAYDAKAVASKMSQLAAAGLMRVVVARAWGAVYELTAEGRRRAS